MGAALQTEPGGRGVGVPDRDTARGKKIGLAAEADAKHKVREEWATLCKRKLTSFEEFSAGGFCLDFLFFLCFFFLENSIDFSGRIFVVVIIVNLKS